MIIKIINKLKFLKKFNVKIIKPLFISIIYFDDIFLKFRIFLVSIFLTKNNRVVKALQELKKNGVAVINNFYSENEIDNLKSECFKLLDNISIEKVSGPEYIRAEPIKIENKVIYLEKLGKSIKLKGLNTINSFFSKIGRRMENNLITMVYHLSFMVVEQ